MKCCYYYYTHRKAEVRRTHQEGHLQRRRVATQTATFLCTEGVPQTESERVRKRGPFLTLGHTHTPAKPLINLNKTTPTQFIPGELGHGVGGSAQYSRLWRVKSELDAVLLDVLRGCYGVTGALVGDQRMFIKRIRKGNEYRITWFARLLITRQDFYCSSLH